MNDTTDLYDLPVRRALDKMPAAVREAWRTNYLTQEDGEHRAQALVERADVAMRERGERIHGTATLLVIACQIAGLPCQSSNRP